MREVAVTSLDSDELAREIRVRTVAAARHVVRGLLEGMDRADGEMRALADVLGPEGPDRQLYIPAAYAPWGHVILQYHREMERLRFRLGIPHKLDVRGADIRSVRRQLGLDLFWVGEEQPLDYNPMHPEDPED